jgi:hypothetical protein
MKKLIPLVEVREINGLFYLFIDGQEQRQCWTPDEQHNALQIAGALLRKRYDAYNNEQRVFRRNGVTFDSFAANVSRDIIHAAVGFSRAGVL